MRRGLLLGLLVCTGSRTPIRVQRECRIKSANLAYMIDEMKETRLAICQSGLSSVRLYFLTIIFLTKGLPSSSSR